MRRFLIFVPIIFLAPLGALAYSVNCSGISGASGCEQCFHFELAGSNSANDIFIPRKNIPSGQQEYIDLSKSSITGQSYQGATVSPTGTITGSFDLIANGPNATASWKWAATKGMIITRESIPSTVNYDNPVYSVRYSSVSHLKEGPEVVPGSEVTHVECAFFYPIPPLTSAPVCGDGKKEGSEQCDDGNTNNNDYCSTSCRLPICGNGVREGNEDCDDGNTRSGDSCTSQCRTPGVTSVCGNGIRESGEDCDDGNTSNDDNCSATCHKITVVSNPRCQVRVFDSQGSVPFTTTFTCAGTPMGRTVIIVTHNNTLIDSSETSSKTLTLTEAGRYTVRCYPDAANDQGNSCTSVITVNGDCGNGIIEKGEQCDDGNTISGDSCDRYCRLNGSNCGNGIVDYGEDCDDGNNSDNDTCSNICQEAFPDSGPSGNIALSLLVALLGAGSLAYIRMRKFSFKIR